VRFLPQWSQDLDEGQQVMVMGRQAYRKANPLETEGFKNLTRYLEADCKALWQILSWMFEHKRVTFEKTVDSFNHFDL
jgi:hypothetical protein